MDIVLLQTADGGEYLDLLTVSARSLRNYCDRQGFAYQAFLGLKRGYFPWHAAFNRIYLLDELVREGRFDWAVYIDADAYIADPTFDLRRYLKGKSRYAAVLTPSGSTRLRWDVNDGVVMLNLRHPLSLKLTTAWRAAHQAVPDADMRAQPTWNNPDDQEMLQAFLRDNPEAARQIHFAPRKLFNSVYARVIRQLVRAHFPDPGTRLRALKAKVDGVLGVASAGDDGVHEQEAADFVDEVYRGVLRRSADPSGLGYFTPLVRQLGFEAGARLMMKQMLASDEYLSRVLTPLA